MYAKLPFATKQQDEEMINWRRRSPVNNRQRDVNRNEISFFVELMEGVEINFIQISTPCSQRKKVIEPILE